MFYCIPILAEINKSNVIQSPDPDNSISPAEILFGRPLKGALPIKPRLQIYDNSYVRPLWKELWNKCEDTLRTRFTLQVETLK